MKSTRYLVAVPAALVAVELVSRYLGARSVSASKLANCDTSSPVRSTVSPS